MKLAIYPGSFDPFTNGHKSILKRACNLFDTVIVVVVVDNHENSLFSPWERRDLIMAAVTDLPHVQVDVFDGLLANYVCQQNAQVIIRGLRMVSDFEYEMQMAAFHKQLCPNAKTIFLAASPENCFVSAVSVKYIVSLGGDVAHFVPKNVAAMLGQKYNKVKVKENWTEGEW